MADVYIIYMATTSLNKNEDSLQLILCKKSIIMCIRIYKTYIIIRVKEIWMLNAFNTILVLTATRDIISISISLTLV